MSDYTKIRETLKAEQDKGSFIFLPSPIMNQADSFYMPVIETVKLREDEIYEAQKKFRIQYNGLLRLSCAAAFEWSAIDTCRTDNRADKVYCSFRAVGGVRKADGRIYFHKAEKDIDLEVVEDELTEQYTNNWSKIGDNKNYQWKKSGHKTIDTYVPAMVRRDLIQRRKNKLMLVESGAKARVIRFVLGLQSQYSAKEQLLNTQFVMVHYALNPNHKDVKQALQQSLPGSMSMIYGSATPPELPNFSSGNPDVIDIKPGEPETPESPTTFSFNPKTEDNIEWFQKQTPPDQEKWLRSHIEKMPYSWEEIIAELKGIAVIEAKQLWRDGLFKFIKEQEDYK